jgi:hypothetical protein
MLTLCIILTAVLCAALMACSYLYAERNSLRALVARQDEEKQELKAANADWITKTLARNSMTPLGEEREETPTRAAEFQAFDLRPPIARMQTEWDREDEEEARRLPLPGEVAESLLEGAREVAS